MPVAEVTMLRQCPHPRGNPDSRSIQLPVDFSVTFRFPEQAGGGVLRTCDLLICRLLHLHLIQTFPREKP